MLARRYGARAFGGCFIARIALQPAHVRGLAKRRIGERRHAIRFRCDEVYLALVPGVQQTLIGQTANQSGVNQADEFDAGDVPRMCVQAADIPNGSLR